MAITLNDERYPLDQFLAGESVRAYEFLGSHFVNWDGRDGVVFRVWAPNALSVSVVGDFNNWDQDANFMYRILDVRLKKTFWQRIFKVGTIEVSTADKTTPVVLLENIKNPDRTRDALSSIAEKERDEKRVLGKEIE